MKQSREELEVQPLVLQAKLEVPSEIIRGLILGGPGPDLLTIKDIALAHRAQAAAGEQRLHQPDAMLLGKPLKAQEGV